MINSKNINLIKTKLSQMGYTVEEGFEADLINEILRQAINQRIVEKTIGLIATCKVENHYGLKPE
jgi:hypothetical protein